MKKRLFIFLITTLMLGLILPSISFASTESDDEAKTKEQLINEFKEEGLITKDINPEDIESIEEIDDPNGSTIQPFISGNEGSYIYWLQSGSSIYSKTTYGSWTNKGSAHHGPGKMTERFASSTSISITATAGLSIKKIKAGLSTSLSKKKSLKAERSAYIPKGKKGQFQVRNVYKYYKVKMNEWISIDGRKSKTGKTKTVTVKKKTGLESKIKIKKS